MKGGLLFEQIHQQKFDHFQLHSLLFYKVNSTGIVVGLEEKNKLTYCINRLAISHHDENSS